MKGISEKLHYIQQTLKCNKNQFNAHGRFNYRSCEDILESVKPLLDVAKCTLTINDSIELIGERYYVKAVVELYDLESATKLTAQAYARDQEEKKGMDSMQITGSASSYARKYALNAMFMIDDNRDADAQEPVKQEPKTEPLITAQQIEIIRQQMTPDRIERMLTFYKKNKLEQLTLKEASDTLAKLKKEGAKA